MLIMPLLCLGLQRPNTLVQVEFVPRRPITQIRDRIKELRRVPTRELLPNPKNWRRHPERQSAALKGLLAEIGIADALIARELSDGRLMLIDGHLRAETMPDERLPVLVVDLTEAEADKVLLTLDPLAGMAETSAHELDALLESVSTDNAAVAELLEHLAEDAKPSQWLGIADAADEPEPEPQSDQPQAEPLGEHGPEHGPERGPSRYLVLVFPSRASREAMAASLGLSPDERYVPGQDYELRRKT